MNNKAIADTYCFNCNKIKQMSEQKKTTEPAKKITIKEFEWYEVETKVRELLTELLQPFTKKQTQDTVKINEIKRNITSITKKLDDHDFLLTQESADKPTYVQLQDDKIALVESNFEKLSATQNEQITQMLKVIEIYQAKIRKINQIEGRIDTEIKDRSTEYMCHKTHVDQQLEIMFKKLENQDGQMSAFKGSTRSTVSKLETKVVILDNKTSGLEDQMKRRTSDIKKIQDYVSVLNEKLAKLDLGLKDLQARVAERQKDYKLSEKFLGKVNELKNDVGFITNYIQYYQPLYNQIQISETINSFLKGTMKTRACIFEEKTFAKMHHTILTMQDDSLESKMNDYTNKIRRIINRNKKYIIRVKVQQTVKYGTNVYEIREIDEALLEEADEGASKPAPIIVPEEEINKIIEGKWEKLMRNLEGTIDAKTKPYQIWIRQNQQQSLMKQVELQKKFQEMRQISEKQEMNIVLHQNDSLAIERSLKGRVESLIEQQIRFKEQIRDLISFNSVMNHIIIQDEIDRQGLALYALKDSSSTETAFPNIHLDDKCVSCSNGNSLAIVSQAFKMACLAYNPSDIKVDDKSFTRQQILEISTNILDRLKKKIESKELESDRQNSDRQNQKESKGKPRSVMSRHSNTKNLSQTIDSRAKETSYLLPVLGVIKKKSSGFSHRQKINI